jgi:hypothetical protein
VQILIVSLLALYLRIIILIEKYAGKAIEKKAAGSAETFD